MDTQGYVSCRLKTAVEYRALGIKIISCHHHSQIKKKKIYISTLSNPQVTREIKAFLKLIKCSFLLTNDIPPSPAAPLPQELNLVQQSPCQERLPNSFLTFLVKKGDTGTSSNSCYVKGSSLTSVPGLNLWLQSFKARTVIPEVFQLEGPSHGTQILTSRCTSVS